MNSVFSFVVALLTAALSLLGFVQQHPELPQASKDQAQQVAQQAITQATNALNTAPKTTQPTNTANTNWKVYSNTEHGFSFKYPAEATLEYPNIPGRWSGTLKWSDGSFTELIFFSKGTYPRQTYCLSPRTSTKIVSGKQVEMIEREDCSSDTGNSRVSSMTAIVPISGEWELVMTMGDNQKTLTQKTKDRMSSILATFVFSSIGGDNNAPDVFSCNPSPVTAKSVPLDVLCGGYGLSANSSYSINFGDGSGSGPIALSAPGRAFGPDGPNNKMGNANHTYTTPGTYTIIFYKDQNKISTATISAASLVMVSIYPADGKPSPSVQASSEYSTFVSLQILSETASADSTFGYIGTVATPKGAMWSKYTQGGNGCFTQRYYRVITSNSSTQTVLVQFKTCNNDFIPDSAILQILATLAWG